MPRALAVEARAASARRLRPRLALGRLLSEKSEQAKQTLRKWRDEAWGEIQEEARAGTIREDDKFKGKEDLQKLIDEYADKIDELGEKKQQEINL